MKATAVVVKYGDTDGAISQVARVSSWADQVIVVANDGSSCPPGLRADWLIPERNLGYGGAANYALGSVRNSVVAVLNTDIFIPAETAESAIATAFESPQGVVGLRMTNLAGDFVSGGGSLSRWLLQTRMDDVEEGITRCTWVTGAALFAPTGCVDQLKFDERFFLGIEDVDFCVRAGTAGWVVSVLRLGNVRHVGGVTVGAGRWYYYSARNPIWMVRSKRGLVRSLLRAALTVSLVPRVMAADLMKRRGFSRSALMIRGSFDGVFGYIEPMRPPHPWEPVTTQRT